MGFGRKGRSLCDCCSPDDDDVPTHTNKCWRCCTPHESFPCKLFVFFNMVALNSTDFISDWLLFIDVRITEKGLVYGPPEDAVIYALLAFSIIGTITFIFEIVNLWWEVFHNNPWLDSDLVSAITIWIEDLPQIAINVYIAKCHEVPISVFQLVKAAIVLIGLLIRIITSLVKYCNKAALHEANMKTAESRRHMVYRIFIMLGLIINAGCAIAIFIFTHTQSNDSGSLDFQVPESIFEDRYNDRRYFQNVGVFVHLPEFDQNTPDQAAGYKANWVLFMLLNDIRQGDSVISYNYTSLNDSNSILMVFSSKEQKWTLPECYQMDKASHIIIAVDSLTCISRLNNSNQANHVYITFSFVTSDPPFNKYIFGDIQFNMKVFKDGKCIESDLITGEVGKNANASAIHYYRLKTAIDAKNALHLLKDGSQYRFYREETDLQDVKEVWKTGWARCDSSGSMAPNLERDILVDC